MAQNGGSRALFFTRVALGNWKNFQSADLALQRRVFLVGPNASGKSNFLDVFRFLRDIVRVGGGFQEAVQQRRGMSAIRSLAARKRPDVGIRVAIGTKDEPQMWEYEIRFAQEKNDAPMLKMERVVRRGEELVRRPNAEDHADPARLTQTYLEQVNVNREFREVAEFFDSVRYQHVVPQLVRDPERSVGKADDPFGGDFLQRIAKVHQKTRTARLSRIVDALSVAVPQLVELELYRDPVKGTPHLRGRYEHWRSRGAWQTEEQWSDGTLRLFGLLWSILDGHGPLLLEEPELSLHPDIVRHLPQMFARIQRRSGRQLFVSTHSPTLLHDEGIGLDEVFVLRPGREGTEVGGAHDIRDVAALLGGGVPLGEIVLAETAPGTAARVALFGDA